MSTRSFPSQNHFLILEWTKFTQIPLEFVHIVYCIPIFSRLLVQLVPRVHRPRTHTFKHIYNHTIVTGTYKMYLYTYRHTYNRLYMYVRKHKYMYTLMLHTCAYNHMLSYTHDTHSSIFMEKKRTICRTIIPKTKPRVCNFPSAISTVISKGRKRER